MRPESGDARGDPWIRYRDTRLYVVPSIHYRQAFAQAVYEACWRRRFDTIAVELPASHRDTGLREAILKIAPHPGFILFLQDELGRVQTPKNGHPDCEDRVLRPGWRARGMPVSPSDSIVMALRAPTLLAWRWPGWQPAVRFIDQDHDPVNRLSTDVREADDYEVTLRGLSTFYSRFERLWGASRLPWLDGPREQLMATRLRRLLEEGREVLFVCGGAHWAAIRGHLDGGRIVSEVEPPAVGTKPILASLHPTAAWFCGWLDEIPRAVWQFEQDCQRQEGLGFDMQAALATVLRESLAEARDAGVPASVRCVALMQRYGERLLAAAGRWIPDLDNDLVPVANACVEARFGNIVKEVGLRYPAPPPEGVESAEFLRTRDGALVLQIGPNAFVLRDPPAGSARSRRLWFGGALPVTDVEKKGGPERSPYLRDWPPEVRLRRQMDARVRELARRLRLEHRSFPFRGAMGQGPDWRATIRSLGRGSEDLYVRERAVGRRFANTEGGLLSPVVWVFDERCQPKSFNSTEQPLTDDDWFHSSFLYVGEETPLAERRIRGFKLVAFVDLFLSRSYASPDILERTPEQQKAADMAYLRTVPADKRCRQLPWRDPDLEGFLGADQAIAAATKYSPTGEVILVSHARGPVAPSVAAYARERGVSICRVSIDEFAPRILDRFRQIHFVPSPIDSFQPPYAWCSRFVPAV